MGVERAAVWVAAYLSTAWAVFVAAPSSDVAAVLSPVWLPAYLAVLAASAVRNALPALDPAFAALVALALLAEAGVLLGGYGLLRLSWRGLDRLGGLDNP